MQWIKKGRIFEPKGQFEWMQKYGILPTPVYIKESNIIRIFFATSALDNIGRITFMDVDAESPSKIIRPPDSILLGEGKPGTFDDCGVNPSQVIFKETQPHLIYLGYQRSFKRPYHIFSGICKMNKDLNGIIDRPIIPMLDRIENEPYVRSAVVSYLKDDLFHLWYVSAFEWRQVSGDVHHNKWLPNYHIKHGTTKDFISFKITNNPVIFSVNKDEFGFGRPWVTYLNSKFCMWYSIRSIKKSYRIGYAESTDCVNWIRKDQEVGIDISESGWDSEMICYPAVINTNNNTYLFYNGNNNGATGFGYAELLN